MAPLIDREVFLKRIRARVGQGYVYGAYFASLITEAYIQSKAAQYPGQYTSGYIQRSRKWIGKLAGDCIGLIKAVYWEDDSGNVRYRYLDRVDTSANGMLRLATVKGGIATMPDMPGLFVHYSGHIGVYLGSGKVIESRGVDYGVVITNLSERPWTSWGQIPYVDYSEKSEEAENMTEIHQGVPKGLIATGLWQTILVALGYDLGDYGPNGDGVDLSFGATSGLKTTQFKKDNGVPFTAENTTVVDASVLKAALAALRAKQGSVSFKELEAAKSTIARLEQDKATLAEKVEKLTNQLADVNGIKKMLENDLQTVAAASRLLDKY